MNPIKTKLTGTLLALALAAFNCPGQTYTFQTIAQGPPTNSDTNLNTNANFNIPSGVAVDGASNVYVADMDHYVIDKISPQGTNWVVTTIAGQSGVYGTNDGTGTNALFLLPAGVALDKATNLYVADQGNMTIRKMTPSGSNWTVSTIAGQPGAPGTNNGTGSAAQFHNPLALAVDSATNIFVADEFNNSIREVSPAGTNWTVTTIAGALSTNGGYQDGSGSQAQFYAPSGVAVDANGRVFVSDSFNSLIRLITPTNGGWVVSTIAGQLIAGHNDGLGTNATFQQPEELAVAPNGNVVVADYGNNEIRELTPSGTDWLVSTIGGTNTHGFADGPGTNARFYGPYGITTDSNNNLYVTDSQNNAVRLGLASGGTNGNTNTPGTLTVTITPAAAVTDGAVWVVNGTTETNGASVSLTPGNYTVSFTNVTGYYTPASVNVAITAGQTTNLTANYVVQTATNTGALTVSILPAGAVAAGAEWQVDTNAFQTNGATVAGLSGGSHTVNFSTVAGWLTPPTQIVTISNGQTTAVTGIYTNGNNLPTFTLTTVATAGGAVTGGGTNVEEGTVLTLTATPTNGFQFVAWTGAGTGTNNPLQVLVLTNATYIANFAVAGSATITVTTNGNGAVSPNLNTKHVVLDHSYSVTASPKGGDIFAGWTGSITTNKAGITFKLTGPMVLQANFVPNPFPGIKGVYNGLFYTPGNVTEQTAGMLKNLTVLTSGSYSGTVLLNGQSHTISGKLSYLGGATNIIHRSANQGGNVTVQFTVNMGETPATLTGAVSGAGADNVLWTAPLMADLADDLSGAAQYSLLLSPDTNSAPPTGSPGGYSYLSVTNNPTHTPANGAAHITAGLADGQTFTQSAPVSSDGFVPVYANLYGHDGFLLGWINLNAPYTNGVGLTWIHPVRNSGNYRGGFTNILTTNQMLVAPWIDSPEAAALVTNLALTPVGGETNVAATNVAITINAHNGQITGGAHGSVNFHTGVFHVTIGSGSTALSGYGALLNSTNATNGGGYFLNKAGESQAIQAEQ